ncbi:MAG: hypothetical protein P8N76_28545 [Pirellulaceae bacterium]|nr:hypothetical protein [Pirellulaceae bacterium]
MNKNTEAENPYATSTHSSEIERERAKLNPLNWKLPAGAIGLMAIGFLLMILAAQAGDGYEAFVYSGFVMLLATPVYGALVVWLTIQRIRSGTNTPVIMLFQLFVLGIMGWWVLLVVTFNGSPA